MTTNRTSQSSARRGGFSRLETLILGGVGALSCLVLWPALAQVAPQDGAATEGKALTDEQTSMQCMQNLKQMSLGAMQYCMDYDRKYPLFAVRTPLNTEDDPAPVGWADAISPYIRNDSLFQCPAEKHESSVKRAKEGPEMRRDAAQLSGFTDYWYNTNLTQIEMTAIEASSRTILFGDGDGGAINSNARYTLGSLPASWVKNPLSPAYRHRNGTGASYAFADGHVKILSPEKVTNKPPSKLGDDEATFEEGVPSPALGGPDDPVVLLPRR